MNDQAQTLRHIASHLIPSEHTYMQPNIAVQNTRAKLRSVAITGGKGGVGKTNLAVNLALGLGELNKQVNLLDADFGLANADLLCGVSPSFHLGHVISGQKQMTEIMIGLAKNVQLIPGGSGIEELANLTVRANTFIFRKLQTFEENLDFMLIDTAAGIGENVIGVLLAAEEVIVVVTPEPTSVVDGYATIKTILKRAPDKQISIVVNNVVGVGDAEQVFQQINAATRRFLNRGIEFLGMVPRDLQLVEAVKKQVPVLQYAPFSPASRAINLIAKQLQKQTVQPLPMQLQSFWRVLSEQTA